MMRLQILTFATAALLAAATSSFAHHSWPVDFSREVTVKGTVRSYKWGNPHVMIDLDVTNASGKTEKWEVGGPSPVRMAGNGWHKESLKVGDVITGTGYRFTDGSNILRLQTIVMPDGKEMFLYGK